MEKLKLFALILVLQLASFFIPLWLVIWLRSDCSGAFSWQCSGNTTPLTIPYITFWILPPVIAKFIFDKAGKKISWKYVDMVSIVLAILLIAISWFIDPSNHPTGG